MAAPIQEVVGKRSEPAALAPPDLEFASTDRFKVVRRLGEGGMGVVYLVDDAERHERVALKTLIRVEPASLYRFKKEFRALADVSHPNLVVLHELISVGDEWFLTMEYVDGQDFFSHVMGAAPDGWVDRTQPTVAQSPDPADSGADVSAGPISQTFSRAPIASEPRLRTAFTQLAHGVLALHRVGKLHRDIKPSNVMVTDAGRVVLLDFGMVDDHSATSDGRQTIDDKLFGTPAYMSPEQAAGEGTSEASDWYSFGVMLFEVLTGVLPFDGSVLDIIVRKQREDAPRPSELIAGVPSDLDELVGSLLRRNPSLRPGASEILLRVSGRRPIASTPPTIVVPDAAGFVGRGPELQALEQTFEAVAAGRPSVAFVEGPSGMGKSALLHRFMGCLQDRKGAVVLAGRCYERESVPFKAIDSLVDSICRYLKHLPEQEAAMLMPRNVHALARLFPVLRQVELIEQTPLRVRDNPEPQELRRRGFGALKELLGRISDRARLAIVVDDLQWGDDDSAALLTHLLTPPDPVAMLVVCGFRTDTAARNTVLERLQASGANAELRRIEVGPLSAEESERLAASVLDDAERNAPGRPEAVAREAEGSPFYIGALALSLCPPSGAERSSDAPISLDYMLAARVKELPGDARAVLESLAVAGRPLEQGLALKAAGLDATALGELHLLRNSHFVRTQGARSRDLAECYHDRVRQSVLRGMAETTVAEVHGRLARAWEAQGVHEPELLASHFRAAGEGRKAARYALQAAEQAAEALAFERAVRFYRMALSQGRFAGSRRGGLEASLASALEHAGRSAEAGQAYMRAVDHVADDQVPRLQQKAVEQFLRSGHVDEGLQALEALLAEYGMRYPNTPKKALASLLFRRGMLRMRGLGYVGRSEEEVAPELLAKIDTAWSVALGLGLIDFVRGADFQTRHLIWALEAGEPYRLARALTVEVGFLAAEGTRMSGRVEEILSMTRGLARGMDNPHVDGLIGLAQGMAHWNTGRWGEAKTNCRDAERILRGRCTGVTWEIATCHLFDAASQYYLGELDEMGERCRLHLREALERGDLYAASDLRTGINIMSWLAAEKVQEARDVVAHEKARWTRTGFHLQHWNQMLADTLIDLYEGQAQQANQRVVSGWSAQRRSQLLNVEVVRVESYQLRAHSALAAALVNKSQRRRLLSQASSDARRIASERLKWSDPLARLIRAAVSHQRGDDAAAASGLEQAIHDLDDRGMGLHAAAARYWLGGLDPAHGQQRERGAAFLRVHGVQNPARLSAAVLPGFRGSEVG